MRAGTRHVCGYINGSGAMVNRPMIKDINRAKKGIVKNRQFSA